MKKNLILGAILVAAFVSICMWGDACVMGSINKMMENKSDSLRIDTLRIDTISIDSL
jgi:hypothetical protein